LAAYSKAYDLKGFKLAETYEVPEGSLKDVERRAHSKLKNYRLSGIGGAREIFSCSLAEARKAVAEAMEQSEELAKQEKIEARNRFINEAIEKEMTLRDSKISELEETAALWAEEKNAKRWKNKEILLKEYNRKKILIFIVGLFFIYWSFLAPIGGASYGIPLSILFLVRFFYWRGKVLVGVNKKLDKNFPLRSLDDYPYFSSKLSTIKNIVMSELRRLIRLTYRIKNNGWSKMFCFEKFPLLAH
tara:strand:- start:240 stop:974 length:735 start_codon:yes stop_codon:yes gene_type:complete